MNIRKFKNSFAISTALFACAGMAHAATALTNGQTTGVAGSSGSEVFYSVDIPAGSTNLEVAMSGGSGDADLYLRAGAAPTTSNYDCRPYASGNNETCSVSNPNGQYHLMVRGYTAFDNASLSVSWQAASGSPAAYNIGTGVYDITGPAAENGMFGYANTDQQTTGIHQRSRSRAFIMESTASQKRVVFVSADLGALFQSVKIEVVKKLDSLYSGIYTHDNVMLTATHTHVAAGGSSHYSLYELASADASQLLGGYSSENFNAIVDGIVKSIQRAHNNLAPGSIEFVQGELDGATKNRSLLAYNNNADASAFSKNTNNTMSVLKFKKSNGNEVGMINWFSVHPTSFSNQFTLISGDNKGYAQDKFEKLKGTDFSASETFVAAFANSDEGDTVAIDGNANSLPGFQGSSDEFLNAKNAGERQYNKGLSLYNQAGVALNGDVDYRHRWANFEDYTVRSEFTNAGNQDLCSAARGYSMAAGGENGPSNLHASVVEGLTTSNSGGVDAFLKFAFTFVGNQDACQEPKPVLFSTGSMDWVPEVMPVQLFVIGKLAIIGVPVETTTMAGRRLRQEVLDQLSSEGVTHVVIAGLANTYSGYLATKEEFAMQHYEGASTEFGQYTLAAYRQELNGLATAIKNNQAVVDDKQPRDRINDYRNERLGVAYDGKYFFESFGQVKSNANASYNRGDAVKVTYRGGHPKNNLRTQDTFIKVQKKEGSSWVTVANDWDWDTLYEWNRDGGDRSLIDITWNIPSTADTGTYRIMHLGNWKNGWTGSIKAYSGISREFSVN